MSLKRPKGDPGTLVVLEHRSRILKGNPLGGNQCVNRHGWPDSLNELAKQLPG
jgi:hypothetical protein